MSLLTPIGILLAGAVLAGLGVRLRFRYTPVIQAVAAALATVAWLQIRYDLPRAVTILEAKPVSLFGMPFSLFVDGYAWGLGLLVLLPVLAASLWWLARADLSPLYPALLAMSACMLMVVSTANVLTLALAWGFLDVVYAAAFLMQERQADGRRVEGLIGLNGVATLLLWVALVFLEQETLSPYWHLITLSSLAKTLLGVATLLRLGLYSHAWSPPSNREGSECFSWSMLLNLLPMVAGVALWVRLAFIRAIPEENIWVWVALAGALLAALLAWIRSEEQRAVPYVAIGYAGLLIVAGSGAGLGAVDLMRGAAAWLLGVYALAMSPSLATQNAEREVQNEDERQGEEEGIQDLSIRHSLSAIRYPLSAIRRWARWLWRLPLLIALAALLGLPATSGWAYRLALYAGLSEGPLAWWGLTVLIETLLAGAVLRCAFATSPAPTFKRRALVVFPVASLATIALPLVIFGIRPGALFAWQVNVSGISGAASQMVQALSVRGWVGWGVPLVGITLLAVGAYLSGVFRLPEAPSNLKSLVAIMDRLGGSFPHWGKGIAKLLDLSWAYEMISNSLRRSARLIGALGALIEGKGALVWTLLIVVLALLYLRQPQR